MLLLRTEEAAGQIARIWALSRDLVLIIALVPDFALEEGLVELVVRVAPASPRLVYRFDSSESGLVPALRQFMGAHPGARPAVVAMGFELVPDVELAQVLRQLNLSRDGLRGTGALVVLGVPPRVRERLIDTCPDLFEWRNLMLRLDAPALSPARVTALEAVRAWARPRSLSLPDGSEIVEPYVELTVVLPNGEEPSFDSWIDSIEHGVLRTPALRFGRSSAIRRLAWEASARALRGHPGLIVVPGSMARWSATCTTEEVLGRTFASLLTTEGLDALVVLEDVDGVLLSDVCRWCEAQRVHGPTRLRFLLIARGRAGAPTSARWSVAQMVAWREPDARAWLRARGVPDLVADRVTVNSPLMAAVLASYWCSRRQAPRDALAVFEDYLHLPTDAGLEEALLASWRSGSSLVYGSELHDSRAVAVYQSLGWLVSAGEGEWGYAQQASSFRWRSIAAWLVARALLRRGQEEILGTIRAFAADRSWHETLRMVVVRRLGWGPDLARLLAAVGIEELVVSADATHLGQVALALEVAALTRMDLRDLEQLRDHARALTAACRGDLAAHLSGLVDALAHGIASVELAIHRERSAGS